MGCRRKRLRQATHQVTPPRSQSLNLVREKPFPFRNSFMPAQPHDPCLASHIPLAHSFPPLPPPLSPSLGSPGGRTADDASLAQHSKGGRVLDAAALILGLLASHECCREIRAPPEGEGSMFVGAGQRVGTMDVKDKATGHASGVNIVTKMTGN